MNWVQKKKGEAQGQRCEDDPKNFVIINPEQNQNLEHQKNTKLEWKKQLMPYLIQQAVNSGLPGAEVTHFGDPSRKSGTFKKITW